MKLLCQLPEGYEDCKIVLFEGNIIIVSPNGPPLRISVSSGKIEILLA